MRDEVEKAAGTEKAEAATKETLNVMEQMAKDALDGFYQRIDYSFSPSDTDKIIVISLLT